MHDQFLRFDHPVLSFRNSLVRQSPACTHGVLRQDAFVLASISLDRCFWSCVQYSHSNRPLSPWNFPRPHDRAVRPPSEIVHLPRIARNAKRFSALVLGVFSARTVQALGHIDFVLSPELSRGAILAPRSVFPSLAPLTRRIRIVPARREPCRALCARCLSTEGVLPGAAVLACRHTVGASEFSRITLQAQRLCHFILVVASGAVYA